MNKLDFIVLAAHGSGLKALAAYLNKINDIHFLYAVTMYDEVINFLNNDKKAIHGIIIDTSYIDVNIILNIKNITKKNFLLIVLTRDPVSRLISVVNTHILRWADSVSNAFEIDYKTTEVYRCGDIKSLVDYIIDRPNMVTVEKLLYLFADYTDNIIHLDVSDLYPDKILKIMSTVYYTLTGKKLINFNTPENLLFSKENNFVNFISKLCITDNETKYYIKPCPVDFIGYYNFSYDQIIICESIDRCGFKIGNFTCDVAFVLCNEQDIGKIRSFIKNNLYILHDYCKKLSERHQFAVLFSKNLLLTNDVLKNYLQYDKNIFLKMKNFLHNQIHIIGKHNPDMLQYWGNSIKFNNDMRSISAV